MTPADFETFCMSLPGATLVIQWGETHVFKVGGKIFAMASSAAMTGSESFMFKVSDMAFELLIEHGLARPAPYLARAKWVQLVSDDALPDVELEAYLTQAHAIIAARLTRALKRELGLI